MLPKKLEEIKYELVLTSRFLKMEKNDVKYSLKF